MRLRFLLMLITLGLCVPMTLWTVGCSHADDDDATGDDDDAADDDDASGDDDDASGDDDDASGDDDDSGEIGGSCRFLVDGDVVACWNEPADDACESPGGPLTAEASEDECPADPTASCDGFGTDWYYYDTDESELRAQWCSPCEDNIVPDGYCDGFGDDDDSGDDDDDSGDDDDSAHDDDDDSGE